MPQQNVSNGSAIALLYHPHLQAVVTTTAHVKTIPLHQAAVIMILLFALSIRSADKETCHATRIGKIICTLIAIAKNPREREFATSPMMLHSTSTNSSLTPLTTKNANALYTTTVQSSHLLFLPFPPVVETAVSHAKTSRCFNSKLLT